MQINVIEYFEKGALVHCPGKVAVTEPCGQQTFAEIGHYAKNCAALILEKADMLRQPIAVFLPKGAQNIVANLGVTYSGNAFANLELKAPLVRLSERLNNLGSSVIITSEAHAQILRTLGIPEAQLLFVEQAMTKATLYDNAALLHRLDAVIDTDPYCFIHTSGSTGIPKVVTLNHRCTIDFNDWAFERFQIDGSEVIGSLASHCFDIFTMEWCMMMAKGSSMIVIPETLATFPAKLVEFVASQPVNFIFWVPTLMVNIANQNLLADGKLANINKVIFGGEVFPIRPFNVWRRQLPQAMFVNLYGPMEISVACTYYIVDREFSDGEELPLGFPFPNTDILILNDQDQPVEGSETGEICIRGSSLSHGYWNTPERTAQAFVLNPVNSHYPEQIYRTGDLGYRNSLGEIMFAGRRDYQVKHLSYRIELREIERRVLQIEGVLNCCVAYNYSKREITLFFESDRELVSAEIRESLGTVLPKYMLPTAFHRMELLPRNPNGKIDRARLAAGLNQTTPNTSPLI